MPTWTWVARSLPWLCFFLPTIAFQVGKSPMLAVQKSSGPSVSVSWHSLDGVDVRPGEDYGEIRNSTIYSLNLTAPEIRSLGSDDRFAYRLEQLQRFYHTFNHTNVPPSFDKGLASWVRTQRYEYRMLQKGKKSLLAAGRIQQLNDVPFDWGAATGLSLAWLEKYQELQEYHKQHGHVLLRASEGPLGKWVANQRYQYARWQQGLRPCSMNPQRIQLLEGLGLAWDYRQEGHTQHDKTWMQHYQELGEFRQQHGHCFVTPKHSKSLHRWVGNQRSAYRDKMKYEISSLTDKREQLLRDLGLDLDGSESSWRAAKWDSHFRQLQIYHQQYNHTLVATSNSSLGHWVGWQRQEYKRFLEGESSSMTLERIQKLESLQFVWKVADRSRRRYEKYKTLKTLYEQYGPRIPADVLRQQQMLPWIQRQNELLEAFQRGQDTTLSAAQIELLESIDMEHVDTQTQSSFGWTRLSWEERLKALDDFRMTHGHTNVRERHDEISLSRWVKQQRVQYKKWKDGRKSTITKDRIQKLNEVGFAWEGKPGRPS